MTPMCVIYYVDYIFGCMRLCVTEIWSNGLIMYAGLYVFLRVLGNALFYRFQSFQSFPRITRILKGKDCVLHIQHKHVLNGLLGLGN